MQRGLIDKINLLIREGEGLTVEFKEKYSSRVDEDKGGQWEVIRK